EKELRELLTSRAWWVLVASMGPLVGFSFIQAVDSYGEVSGLGGTTGALSSGLSPLDGIWVPTFGACSLAATFLLPFVAIRSVAGDRQTGALKLLLQQHASPAMLMSAKVIVLVAGWFVAAAPVLIAMALWTR